jgi:hypothetical protein
MLQTQTKRLVVKMHPKDNVLVALSNLSKEETINYNGEKTIEEMGEDILEYRIKAASGEIIPKAVQLNQDDFYSLETWCVAVILYCPG